jgi:putative isomerase
MSNYLVWEGLKAYGYVEEAKVLAERSIELLDRDTGHSAGWHENYQPETGEGISGPGFVSWNLLVFNMLEDLK